MAHFLSALASLLVCFLAFISNGHAYAITGISEGVEPSGQRPFRTEINEFAKSGAPFDLYILALQKLQQFNESETVSHFQIAGIHGYPVKDWDGAPGNAAWGWGYCIHDNPLFPTWHRPYVALYEQALWEAAQSIAEQYTGDQKGRYVQAALRFRIPYWDWAINPAIPSVASSPTISINTPTGVQSIGNPLYQYRFHSRPAGNGFPEGDASGAPPFTSLMNTVRWPDDKGNSQNNLATQNFQQNSAYLMSTVYQVFTSGPNYNQISTSASSQTSIEYVHDVVHYLIGGPRGHMNYLQWAGFDPMFFLHHTNVDRIFAIWQAIYPDSYVGPWTVGGTYAIEPGTTVNDQTELSPFHSNDGGSFWTSASARSTRSFGYTYPEVVDWNISASDLSANVRQKVNQLYNPSAGSSRSRRLKRTPSRAHAFPNKGLATLRRMDSVLFHQLEVNNLNEQWVANLKVDKFALNSSFNIDLFLGPPPESQAEWPLASNLIGTFPVLSSAGLAPPSYLAGGAIKHAEIPLTPYLAAGVAGGVIDNLEAASVLPLLEDSLEVRVRSPNGATLEGLSGFEMTVSSRNVNPPATIFDFPDYGAWVAYPAITADLTS